MGKRPAFQFYTGDWRKDPQLRMCAPSTRGIWIDLICAMWENDESGEIEGTVVQLARAVGCFPEEMAEALYDLSETGAADVFARDKSVTRHGNILESHIDVTVINRRMQRDEKSRDSARIRQQRKRGKDVSHADVTQNSRSLSSSSTSVTNTKVKNHPSLFRFEDFWSAYPKRKSRGQAEKAWQALRPNEQLVDAILVAIERAKTSADWLKSDGQFVPYPASWLRARGWEDELALTSPERTEPRFREVC